MSWSPSTVERARSVPPSTRTKNIMDPDLIDEYRRQKEMELESMKRHEEEAEFYRNKQVTRIVLTEIIHRSNITRVLIFYRNFIVSHIENI